MRDDALAPIIAVMLILAAIVTFLSIWNAVYVPSLKESAEVDHLHAVETSFVHFSSDIDQAVSSHQDGLVFTEPVQLGGGDTMVNPLKSSGTLSVTQDRNTSRAGENTIYTITFYNSTSVIGELNGTLVNFSYEPVNNFWQDQGYRWQFGYINVTKYGTLSTPYSYSTMENVVNETESGSLATFARSFGEVEYTANRTNFPVYSTTIARLFPNSGENLTTISISGSNFTGAINVTFGNTPVLCNGTATGCTVNNDTSITANSQEGTGTVDVIVYTSNGTETAQNAYTYGSSSASSSWYPTPVSYSPGSGNCSSLNILAVNVTAAPDHAFSSSNGFGTLRLTSHLNSVSFDSPVTGVSVLSDQEPFGNATADNLNEIFSLANATCPNNIYYNATASDATLHHYQYDIVQTESPVNVTLTVDEIEIGVY